MATARLYHNADCSKCRGALALLIEHEVEVEVVNYLERPPGVEQLRDLLDKLRLPALALVRDSDAVASARVVAPGASEEAILRTLAADPRLLQRPILVVGERAVIARPPERVLEII